MNCKASGTLTRFFLITFTFTWFFWLLAVLASADILILPFKKIILVGIGAHGPLVSALWLSGKSDGWKGIKKLVRSGFNLRLSLWNWLVIILLPIVLAGIAMRWNMSLNHYHPDESLISQPLLILPMFFFMFFLGGSVQEEFGWRGFALPRLMMRRTPFISALVLGLIWGIWHLPLFYISSLSQTYMNFGVFMILTLCFSVIMTVFYLSSGRNLFTALLFHTSVNTSLSLFPPIEQVPGGNQTAFTLLSLLYLSVTLTVIIFQRKRLFKKQGIQNEAMV